MAGSIQSVLDYPEVSFIDGYTAAQLEEEMLSWYKEKWEALNGTGLSLPIADERRLILSACAYYLFLGYKMVDNAGKMGMLKYAVGDFLENLGALKGISRAGAAGATVTLRYAMASPRGSATGIPAGSRVTSGDGVYFATDAYAEIPAGESHVDIPATCLTAGAAGNLYAAGELNIMVDIVPYIDSVSNVEAPVNGRDEETDDGLRARIYEATDAGAAGGTKAAYKYMVLEYDPTVADVYVYSTEPREVRVMVLLSGGGIPGDAYLKALEEYISADDRKMLTDKVAAEAPGVASYTIDVTYYINESDRASAQAVQQEVEGAVSAYQAWQRGRIGRDLNPDEMVKRMLLAGAKRAVVRSPSFAVVPNTSVAVPSSVNVVYGGLEGD